jgi:hypothetical protein
MGIPCRLRPRPRLAAAGSACLLLWAVQAAYPAASPDAQTFPEVACRYEIRETNLADHSQTRWSWLFWRSQRMIQTADGNRQGGDIWERNAQNQIFYRRLYHPDRTAVEYMPADSAVDHRNFDWTRLSTLVDRKTLDRLPVGAAVTIAGRTAQRRFGRLDGWQTEILWLAGEHLPARLSKSDGRLSIEMELVDLRPLSEAPIPPVPVADIDRYRQIDHADLGDMESDPFVRKLDTREPHDH